MKESVDIQIQLHNLCVGMTPRNIYSQLSYFLVERASKDETHSISTALMHIQGLLSDSYFGMIAAGDIKE